MFQSPDVVDQLVANATPMSGWWWIPLTFAVLTAVLSLSARKWGGAPVDVQVVAVASVFAVVTAALSAFAVWTFDRGRVWDQTWQITGDYLLVEHGLTALDHTGRMTASEMTLRAVDSDGDVYTVTVLLPEAFTSTGVDPLPEAFNPIHITPSTGTC